MKMLDKEKLKCSKCEKIFSNVGNKNKHEKRCKVNEDMKPCIKSVIAQGLQRKVNEDMKPCIKSVTKHGLQWEVNEDGEKLINVPNLQHPFTCMVSGPTGCGKSTFITKLLQQRQEAIHPPPERVIWCYSEWQPVYDSMIASVEFHQGVPEHLDSIERTLVILDDLMSSVDSHVTELYLQKVVIIERSV